MFWDSSDGIEEYTTSATGFINKCMDDIFLSYVHRCSFCPGVKRQYGVQQRLHHLWIFWGGMQMGVGRQTIKFADDTTVVGLITNNDETAYRKEV